MDAQNVSLLSQSLRLEAPSPEDFVAAHRRLSPRGLLQVACASDARLAALQAAERAGFVGMTLDATGFRAGKGKEGRCYETGRRARYLGSAAGVMDDDRHLLFGELRVCEKTARVYASPLYQRWIRVTDGDPALLARLDADPAPFDCDTFAADAAALNASLSPANASPGSRQTLIYPGPFKLLVLRDGALVRRGLALSLPSAQARELVERDGAIPSDAAGVEPKTFRGSAAALLDDAAEDVPPAPPPPPRLAALLDISVTMRRRLDVLLERREEYFLLTGSDPAQKDGCCPSNDVGEANRLVDAGILGTWAANADSACPTGLYALAGEIATRGGKPAFTRNEALRAQVHEHLVRRPGLGRKLALRFALIALAAAALAAIAWELFRQL